MIMPKKKIRNIEMTEVKEILRKVISEKYGGVTKFICTEYGKKLDGTKIRSVLFG